MTHRYGHHAKRHAAAAACPPPDPLTPADRYAEFFVAVQSGGVFSDSKTFVDCVPRMAPEAILAAYRAACGAPGFDLRAFVGAHFRAPHVPHSDYVSVPGQALADHIDALWPVLTRRPQHHPPHSSHLQLPHDYVVPGGRFGELYYWDSYFTMLGLAESGCAELLHAMTDNFAYLIDTFGHVPNGTRTYYLSRSQPPVFALMVDLCEAAGGQPAAVYLPQLLKEHAFWMDGTEALAPGAAHRRVVRLADGTLLNRYWDERDTPREEAWIEDVRTARESGRPESEVWRDLRAAAESGWDFSSRWLVESDDGAAPSTRLADIRTTDILPVDLNAFLFKAERVIAGLSRAAGDAAQAERFEVLAERRREAVLRLMWDDAAGTFTDRDWRLGRLRRALTAACTAPLFVGLADAARAARQAETLERRLLGPGGVATTEIDSGQQWDRPNGWAPLQWMAIEGFAAYGHRDLADTIAERWLAVVGEVYDRQAKLVEKYALRDASAAPAGGGHGGEYLLQDGFGWTNGVARRLLDRHFAADRPVSSSA